MSEMSVRVRFWEKEESFAVKDQTTVMELKIEIEHLFRIGRDKQWLMFRGKIMEDDYTLWDYGVENDNTIQMTIKQAVDTKGASTSEKSRTPAVLPAVPVESKYFRLGDLVDVKNSLDGSWIEGRVTGFFKKSASSEEKESDDGILYEVTYKSGSTTDTNLEHLRPRARSIIKFNALKVNDVIMANYNIEDPKSVGSWYDVKITRIVKTKKSKKLIGDVILGERDSVLTGCKIIHCNDILLIEKNKLLTARSLEENEIMQTEPPVPRLSEPLCSFCQDDPEALCRECSCNECGGKDRPSLQIMCDECAQPYHIWCLNPPLEEVPSEDWYCPLCKNDPSEIVLPGTKLKSRGKNDELRRKKGKSQQDVNTSFDLEGEANFRSNKSHVIPPVPVNHYGSIPGVEVGTTWLLRRHLAKCGVHRSLYSGIHGRQSDGAYSILLGGGYEDNVDHGNEFVYTGSGGQTCHKGMHAQTQKQELKRVNIALALNCNAEFSENGAEADDWKGGKPVRVVRSANLKGKSRYAPHTGFRYDGIYKVVKYFPEVGKSGFVVWKFHLRRDDPSPAPWTPEGKSAMKKLEAIASPKKTSSYKLPKDINRLVKKDVSNKKQWDLCKQSLKGGKERFLQKVNEEFTCICCQGIARTPVTTPCNHNFCMRCLKKIVTEKPNCPICRHDLKKKDIKKNIILTLVLKKLFNFK